MSIISARVRLTQCHHGPKFGTCHNIDGDNRSSLETHKPELPDLAHTAAGCDKVVFILHLFHERGLRRRLVLHCWIQ